MKPIASMIVLALSLGTCACGGGGSGSGGIASTPVPVPSPTPTPTQGAGFTPTVTPTETLPGTTAAIQPIGTTGVEEILDATRVSIGRDASGNYLITLPVATGQTTGLSQGFLRKFEFLAANRTTTASGAQQFANGRSGSIFPNEKSALTILPARTAANPLNYVNFASLTLTLADTLEFGDPAIPGQNAMVFGERTVAGDVPLAGSASYTGTFATSFGSSGFFVSCPDCDGTAGGGIARAGQLSGDLRFSVSFADKSVSGSFTNISDSTGWFSYTSTDANHRIADMALSGSFSPDGTLSGTIASTSVTPFTGGIWNGMFFGPQAAEVGGSMILRASIFDRPAHFTGWFGGKKD